MTNGNDLARPTRAGLWPLCVRARFKRGERGSHARKNPDKKLSRTRARRMIRSRDDEAVVVSSPAQVTRERRGDIN